MASLTWWTWVWVNSGSWWWTGRPGMLRFMGSQRVRHDWETELNWTEHMYRMKVNYHHASRIEYTNKCLLKFLYESHCNYYAVFEIIMILWLMLWKLLYMCPVFFTQQIIVEYLLCVRNYARYWWYGNEYYRCGLCSQVLITKYWM